MKSENNQQQNLGCKSLRMVRFEISHLTPVSRSNRLSIKVPCLECFRMVFACFNNQRKSQITDISRDLIWIFDPGFKDSVYIKNPYIFFVFGHWDLTFTKISCKRHQPYSECRILCVTSGDGLHRNVISSYCWRNCKHKQINKCTKT